MDAWTAFHLVHHPQFICTGTGFMCSTWLTSTSSLIHVIYNLCTIEGRPYNLREIFTSFYDTNDGAQWNVAQCSLWGGAASALYSTRCESDNLSSSYLSLCRHSHKVAHDRETSVDCTLSRGVVRTDMHVVKQENDIANAWKLSIRCISIGLDEFTL